MRRALAALLLALLPALVPAAPAERPAGRIDFADGKVSVTDATGKARNAQVGAAVEQGDTVATGDDGEVHLKLDDGSLLALRPQARMRIDAFRNVGRDDDRSVVSLFSGAMRAITGWIGRRAPERVRIKTPTATIGVRGTDHEAYVVPAGSELGPAGTYDKVNAGATRLETPRGSVDVTPGQAAFAAPGAAPVVLPSVPDFFRPGRNDDRLAGLHDAMQRSLDKPAAAGTGGAKAGLQAKPKGQAGSGVNLQGDTRINATAKDASAVAAGSGNQAGNKIGTIGGH